MAHPDAKLVSVADFSKATVQAPAFLRAAGAADEMEDILISLVGRPEVRKGYVRADTDALNIGTADGRYRSGDQIAVVHWLGDADTPEGIKRVYYLPRDASWVQDEVGRLLFVAAPGETPFFVDLKDNVVYEWRMDAPFIEGGSTASFNMSIAGHPAINANRDLDKIASGDYETAELVAVWPSPATEGVFIDVRAHTDITYADVYVVTNAGDIVRFVHQGRLAEGGHRFFWDGRNAAGNIVAAATYTIFLAVDDIPGKIIEVFDNNEDSEQRVSQTIALGDPRATPTPTEFYMSAQFRYVCYTYANPELSMESLPSFIAKARIYFWHVDDTDPPGFNVLTVIDVTEAPDWATQINIYVSEEPTPPEETTFVAVETGFVFRRLGTLLKDGDGFASTLSDYAGTIDRDAEILDAYDHDGPVADFRVVANYGIGLWGAAKNRVYFSKTGSQGEQRLYALPSEHALVSHSFPLPRSGQSPVLHIHPAAHEAALMVFKRDAIHIIRGKGVISGLYDPETPVQVDVDASSVIVGTGTMSPRSVLTVGSSVYFVGSDNRFYQFGTDWRGRTDLRDVGLPIQRYLNELSIDDLETLTAFLYQNCYHLITPDRVIVMDMTRKYWTSLSWQLKDAFWSRGGLHSESILYGLTQDDALVELFSGSTDDGEPIGGVWQSNPVAVPSESSITGVLAVHTDNPPLTLNCRLDIDDVEGEAREFTPAKYNDFRCGFHGYGSRAAVRLQSEDGFPRLDRIELEVFTVR